MSSTEKSDGGFSLVEVLTIVAMISVITGSLYALMNNMNTQSERMRVTSELLRSSTETNAQIRVIIGRAGYTAANTPIMTRAQAIRFPTSSHIQICADNIAGTRQLIEFKTGVSIDGVSRLQRRDNNTNCTIDNLSNWSNISDPVFKEMTFSMASTIPASHVVEVTYVLKNKVPGTDEEQELTRQHLIPTYSLIGLN